MEARWFVAVIFVIHIIYIFLFTLLKYVYNKHLHKKLDGFA